MQPQTNTFDEPTQKEDNRPGETIRELDYSISDKEGIKLPVSYFSAKNKTKPETLLYNITRLINTNDTSDIDFTFGGTNGKELVPFCSRFCDNIILYFVISEDIIKHNKTLANFVKYNTTNDPQQDTTTGEETAENTAADRQLNKVLREISPFLANNTEHIRELFNKFGVPINKTHIKPTSFKADKGTIKQFVKVALPDIVV